MVTSIAAAVVVLGLLIVVHEFGHFILAKRLGVGVIKFSLGFGPKLASRVMGGTEYALSAIPLGGFVKMVGEDSDAEEDGEQEPVDPSISFSHQPLWKRFAIVGAGPGLNIAFAVVAFSFVFAVYGARVPSEAARVGRVADGMPAAQAGLQAADVVTAVDGRPIETWDDLFRTIRASGGREIEMTIQRGRETLQVRVAPERKPEKSLYGEVEGEAFFVGIERGFDERPVGPIEAVGLGFSQTGWWIKTMVVSVVKLVQGRISRGDVGGPILIVQEAGKQARIGLENLLHFMAVISINLGILNLLPIPVLDGGHLFFFGMEAVMRRPLDIRHREIAQQIGLAVLIALMAFAFYNDIARIIRGWG